MASLLTIASTVLAYAAPPIYTEVVPGFQLQFPRDYGAHPGYRTEWWYVTGWLTTDDGKPLGFQVTFFRSRMNVDDANPSSFAPRHIVFAHAAISDPANGRLLHDQRSARAGFGLAEAHEGNTAVHIDDWNMQRSDDKYTTHIRSSEFAMDLVFAPTQSVMPQGERGYSRKGPAGAQASYYYSEPHLQVRGTVTRRGTAQSVRGTAWLDHEWSSSYLSEDASGWDWTGINLDDGGALMLFQIRGKNGERYWAGGTLRGADGSIKVFAPDDIGFAALRKWRSPRTGTEYPVGMRVRAAALSMDLQPLLDDQELDSRASTGAVYWEGAVEAKQNGNIIGRGYLELTGYFKPLAM
jgi:predicted secreted hydrolase